LWMVSFRCHSIVQYCSAFTVAPWSRISSTRMSYASQNCCQHTSCRPQTLNLFFKGNVVCFHSAYTALDVSVKWQTHVSSWAIMWLENSRERGADSIWDVNGNSKCRLLQLKEDIQIKFPSLLTEKVRFLNDNEDLHKASVKTQFQSSITGNALYIHHTACTLCFVTSNSSD
jgi:hypothetical protein